jgi:manganese/zinc/iron transport system substrate-binding protein
LFLEGQFDTVFAALREQGVEVHALSDPVKRAGFTIGGFELSEELVDVDDPHFWFDPRNWELTITDFGNTLAEIDPEHADNYRTAAAAYAADMTAAFQLGRMPVSVAWTSLSAYLVTSHDAFQYFGAAFGWQWKRFRV